MRTSRSGSRAFVLLLSSLDFIKQRVPLKVTLGGLSAIIQPIFTVDAQGQSNSLWESLLSVEVANILLPLSARSEFGPLRFIKYCMLMS